MVIGADGARSTVRRSVTPEHPEAVYAGFLLWRAMVPESDLPAEILPAQKRGAGSRKDRADDAHEQHHEADGRHR